MTLYRWVSEQSAVTIASLKRVIAASHRIFMKVKSCNARHHISFVFPYFGLANACCIFVPAKTAPFHPIVYNYFLSFLHFSLYLFIRCLLIYFSFSFVFLYSFVFLPVYCECFLPFTFLCLPLFISLAFHFVYSFMSFDDYSFPSFFLPCFIYLPVQRFSFICSCLSFVHVSYFCSRVFS